MNDRELCKFLRELLVSEFSAQYKNGAYGYIQKIMTYNSNHIEGSTLTQGQTNMLFDTKTFDSDGTSVRTQDIEEAQGHFLMFNHMVKTLDEPLTEKLIKEFHYCLKAGVFNDRLNGYAIGEYKKRANIAGDVKTVLPADVPSAMKSLLEWYSFSDKNLDTLAMFHAKYEKIHPFQDGNGRTGRLILFRETLINDICPLIIFSENRMKYINGIKSAQDGYSEDLYELLAGEQSRFRKEISYFVETAGK